MGMGEDDCTWNERLAKKEMVMRMRLTMGMEVLLAIAGSAAATEINVTVDGSVRYQTIEGFGTCLIAWVGRFRELYRTEDFQRIYVEGVGCNMLRVNMWGPTFEKPTEDWTQIRGEDFDMGADGGRPQIFVLSLIHISEPTSPY